MKGENFFAGGKTFQALPPSMNPSCNKNAKLNFIANSNAKATVKEMIKNPNIKIMPGSGKPVNENSAAPSAMVQSYKHGGRLLAAALGQSGQNQSLMKSKELKGPDAKVASISASQLLKQKQEEFLALKRQKLKERKLAAAKAQEERNSSSGSTSNGTSGKRDHGLILAGAPPKSMFSHLALSNSAGASKDRAKIRAAAVLAAQKSRSPDEKKKAILAKIANNVSKTNPTKSPTRKNQTFLGKSLEKVNVKGVTLNLKIKG